MKALTIRQPWATLIALGVKTIETRSWRAPKALIGQRIAIHAGKSWPEHCSEVGPYMALVQGRGHDKAARMEDGRTGRFIELPLGAVVAIATLADCVRMHHIAQLLAGRTVGVEWPNVQLNGHDVASLCDGVGGTDISDELPYGDFRPGRWAWMLTDIHQLAAPIPATGKQGVWEWTP